ncbi:MAG: UvrD-helicase domain-containing protein [Bulleidia sp.]
MAKKFDEQQRQAIEALGSNVLVSASAGAGKTGVLVERLTKRAVRDRVPISRIAAMTFTQAAAEEMKKRLAGRLNEEYAKSQDEQEKEFLNAQLASLQSADITTIDSYCLTIIRKYYSTIGLDPKTTSRILDEGTANIYKRQAFDTVIARYHNRKPEEVRNLLEMFSPRSEDFDTLFTSVMSINLTAQAGMDPAGWYEQARAMYAPVRTLKQLNPQILKYFTEGILSDLAMMKSCLSRMKILSEGIEKVKPETLHEEEILITNCENRLRDFSWEGYRTSLITLAEHKTSPYTKDREYTAVRKKLDDQKKNLLTTAYPESILVQDHNDMSPVVSLLVDIAEDTWQAFRDIKTSHACMDFTDMERFAYEILQKNNGTVASIIRDSLDEILVDEFQDTSELQNAIITAISNGHNVFRVGDVKQSIYRFRQAKPELMRSLMHDPDTTQITLRHNYRSKDSIVRFTNLLFSKIMNIEGCQDTYTELDTVSIGENNPAQMEETLTPVTFAYIPYQKDNEQGFDPKRAKADWISSQILKMMKEDPSLQFRDFAILVRSHADKSVIRTSLESCNIPYDIDGRDGFYQSDLALTILSMVHVMLDENDTLHLLAVLTSPFCHYSDNDLAQMKIRHGSLLKAVRAENPALLEKLQYFRAIAQEKDVPTMLSEIALTDGFYNRLPLKDQANFDFLFEKMINAQCDSLHAFLDTMEAGQDEKSSEAMSRGSDDNAVIATTIHQSKGLQYRIVFLWGTSSNRFNDASAPVIVNEALKLGISYMRLPYRAKRPTVERMAVEYATNLEDVQEFVRLLYVAVTRAEQRLFLVDCLKQPFTPMDLNVSFLLSRKGITGTMDIPLQGEELYQTETIDIITKDRADALPPKYASALPEFHTPYVPIPSIVKPSSLETVSLPPLSLKGQGSGTAYGTRIHEVMEHLPVSAITPELLFPYDLSETEQSRILAFGDSPLYHKALSMHVEKEYPFYIETENYRTNGTMDMIAYSDQEVIIIDFKTDRASLSQIEQRYHDQLNAYRKAAEYIWPDHTIHIYAYSFHNDKEIEILQ